MRTSLPRFTLFTCTMLASLASAAWAKEHDLKGTLGRTLEVAIASQLPSAYRQHVTVGRLTIDERGTVRGKVTAQYGEWKSVPGVKNPLTGKWIREPQRWKIWSARVVTSWTTHYLNPALSDVKIDVGNIKGAVSTGSVKRTVANWIGAQVAHFKRFAFEEPPAAPQSKPVRVVIKLGPGYNEYKSYDIDGERFVVRKGQERTHTQSAIVVDGKARVTIRYDAKLGSGKRYVTKEIGSGTYEFRRDGSRAYLAKIS